MIPGTIGPTPQRRSGRRREAWRDLDPSQRLAWGVVVQAARDLRDRDPAVREDAARFLAGDWRFDLWCAAAGADPERLRARLEAAGVSVALAGVGGRERPRDHAEGSA